MLDGPDLLNVSPSWVPLLGSDLLMSEHLSSSFWGSQYPVHAVLTAALRITGNFPKFKYSWGKEKGLQGHPTPLLTPLLEWPS